MCRLARSSGAAAICFWLVAWVVGFGKGCEDLLLWGLLQAGCMASTHLLSKVPPVVRVPLLRWSCCT